MISERLCGTPAVSVTRSHETVPNGFGLEMLMVVKAEMAAYPCRV